MSISNEAVQQLIKNALPDADVIVFKVLDVRASRKKPEKLVDNRAQVDFFGRHQRKTLI